MTNRELFESMSKQIGALVRHVGEPRQSNLLFQEQLNEFRRETRAKFDALRSAYSMKN